MASSQFLERLSDITECPICTETLRDPRVLSCQHTFCLGCLEQYGKQNAMLPRNKMSCPLCREKCVIPSGKFSNLPKNFVIDQLLDARKASDINETMHHCDVCLRDHPEEESKEVQALRFCVECEENMCGPCSIKHQKMKMSMSHQVLPIGSRQIRKEPTTTKRAEERSQV